MRLRTKLDLLVYLLMVAFIVTVSFGMLASGASALGLIAIRNDFLSGISDDRLRNMTTLVISCGPLAAFLFTYQQRARHPLRWWEAPAYGLLFALYAYMFMTSQIWAWARLLSHRQSWAKTPRVLAREAV
jgi:hypothetical protein